MALAPTNRRLEFTGMSIMKIVDGKIARGWDNWDQLALLTQIGAVPKRHFWQRRLRTSQDDLPAAACHLLNL